MTLRATYTQGTYRLCAPEATLQRIEPLLARCGITRCADVSRLDPIDLPSYSAIRPNGYLLQVSSGKGLTSAAARASALMEALELFHAETPEPERLTPGSRSSLVGRLPGRMFDPRQLPGFYGGYYGEEFVIQWTGGINLHTGQPAWVPASIVYFGCEPVLHNTSTNGLASGNHPVEAQLHALFEVIERDVGSSLFERGKLNLAERCRILDPGSVGDPRTADVLAQIAASGSKPVVLWVDGELALHTFWVVILNRAVRGVMATMTTGWGSHLDPSIAFWRALTEAVQSRTGFIHGGREDIRDKPGSGTASAAQVQSSQAYRYFDRLAPDATWSDIVSGVADPGFDLCDLEATLAHLLDLLLAAGHDQVLGFDLGKPALGVPVVKVLIPSMTVDPRLF